MSTVSKGVSCAGSVKTVTSLCEVTDTTSTVWTLGPVCVPASDFGLPLQPTIESESARAIKKVFMRQSPASGRRNYRGLQDRETGTSEIHASARCRIRSVAGKGLQALRQKGHRLQRVRVARFPRCLGQSRAPLGAFQQIG